MPAPSPLPSSSSSPPLSKRPHISSDLNDPSPDSKPPCYAFQKGQCSRGDSCRYSHSSSSSASSAAASNSGLAQPSSSCFAFQRGQCTRGDACKFSHGAPQKFCPDFANGECLKGDKCLFSHGPPKPPAIKPDFGLSGALAKDAKTGNLRQGKQVKWAEPADAKLPTDMWRLYVFNEENLEDTLHLHRQSAFLFGRDKQVADIHLDTSSCSKEHAVLQFRQPVGSSTSKPYIIDLESTNGTKLNNEAIVTSRYVELLDGDMLTFADFPKEFVLKLAEKKTN